MLNKFFASATRWLLGIGGILIFLVTWEYISTSWIVNPLFISSPSKVALAALKMFPSADFLNGLFVSGQEFFIGFGLAIVIGVPLGLLMGRFRKLHFTIGPLVSSFNVVPVIALMPIFVILFGIGLWSKIAMVFFGAILPIILNTSSGAETATLSSRGLMPFILRGIRLGVYPALLGIIVGELIASTTGIGYLMAIAGANFQVDKLFALFFVLMIFAVLFTELLNRLEHRYVSTAADSQ